MIREGYSSIVSLLESGDHSLVLLQDEFDFTPLHYVKYNIYHTQINDFVEDIDNYINMATILLNINIQHIHNQDII
jgi:hypothetical protein